MAKKKATKPQKFTIEDYKAMPKELQEQMVFKDPPPQAMSTKALLAKIVTELDTNGKGVDLNSIIIEYYNRTQKVMKRQSAYANLSVLNKEGAVRHCGPAIYGAAK